MQTGRISKRTTRRAGCLWYIIITLVAVTLGIAVYAIIHQPRPNRNALAIGELATSPSLEMEIHPPVELNYLSKAEVLALRTEEVYRYPELLEKKYRPSDLVFGQIVSGRPWWGIKGHFYYDRGQRSIEGPAEESRFIMNPYLLVGAEFGGLSMWYGNLVWDTARIGDEQLNHPAFPYYCEAQLLRWWPAEAYADVTYDVSTCVARINRWTLYPLDMSRADFDLVAYNARDMNLNYIYVSYTDSRNISKSSEPASPIPIRHYIHRGTSCGYPGGCNNMSPPTPETDNIRLNGLPAKVVVWLWKELPESPDAPPDMTFVLWFK